MKSESYTLCCGYLGHKNERQHGWGGVLDAPWFPLKITEPRIGQEREEILIADAENSNTYRGKQVIQMRKLNRV